MSLFSRNAQGIDFLTDNEFFEALGYLAKPSVIEHFEAQVPDDKIAIYRSELPGQDYYEISNDNLTSGGNRMKNGIQLRIYLGHTLNMPLSLKKHVVKGKRINKGLFAEELLKKYGFNVGFKQNPLRIRNIVLIKNPRYITDFDRGFHL